MHLFENGVDGMLLTGQGACGFTTNQGLGTEGILEIGRNADDPLRLLAQHGWQSIRVEGGLHGLDAVQQGVLDLIDALKTGREPELSGRRSLRATELIFATYESSRRRARIDLPLDIDDSPLHAMLDAAMLAT